MELSEETTTAIKKIVKESNVELVLSIIRVEVAKAVFETTVEGNKRTMEVINNSLAAKSVG